MKLAPDDLSQITATTLGHYNKVAEDFREGTRDHDVSQNSPLLNLVAYWSTLFGAVSLPTGERFSSSMDV